MLARGRSRGFTLVELAIVLVIVAVLASALALPLSTQIDNRRVADTQAMLAEAREAVIGFALANGRLPCPADPTLATGSAGAGQEDRSGGALNPCDDADGVLPWATLGVPELDAWGYRYTYRVSLCFADDPSTSSSGPCAAGTAQSSFLLSNNGTITVRDAPDDAAPPGVVVADNVPFVIVSHGRNGAGAYRSDGTPVAGAADHELDNADADASFVSHEASPTFDDLVVWTSLPVLMNKMVTAGKLP
jgi:prepilin-type N-terminal cleavage/methylation domain-containing protein